MKSLFVAIAICIAIVPQAKATTPIFSPETKLTFAVLNYTLQTSDLMKCSKDLYEIAGDRAGYSECQGERKNNIRKAKNDVGEAMANAGKKKHIYVEDGKRYTFARSKSGYTSVKVRTVRRRGGSRR